MLSRVKLVQCLIAVMTLGPTVACSAGPAAAPTAAPTAAPSKPAESAAPAAKPAAVPEQSPAATKPAAAAKPAAEAKPAAQPPTTAADVFLYNGPDRQKLLEEGARKEGKLLWYTSSIIQDRARPLADQFRTKYPYITVDIVRLEGNEAVSKVTEEYRANKFDADFLEQSYPAITALKEAGVLSKFSSPSFDDIPAEVRDPEGYFAADRENPLGLAYNTQQVPDAEAPKTYDDLLNPKWKSKLATQSTSQGVQALGAMLLIKGDEYVRKLAQQDVQVQDQSARAVTDLVVAGEVTMTFPSSIGHVVLHRKNGAPINWVPLDQSPTALGYVAVMSKAPHPYATMLIVDWMLSEEGQKAMAATGEGATRKGIPNDYGGIPEFKKFYTDLAVPAKQYQAEFKKWSDLQKSLFVKRP